jgi:predicted DNA-binding protein
MNKIKNMSIALDIDFQEKLKALAKTKNVSVSSLIRETLEKYLFTDINTVKLILSLPKDVTSDSKRLELWLNQKSQAIMRHFKS